MASSQTIDKVNDFLSRILSYDAESLLKNPIWGEADFAEGIKPLQDIQIILRPLGSLPLRFIPERDANEIVDSLVSITETIDQITNYRITVQNAQTIRVQLISKLTSLVDELYKRVAPHAAYLALQSGDLSKVASDLATQQKEINVLTEQAKSYAEESKSEVDEIIRTAREVAGNAGVGHFSSDFSDQAEAQRRLSGAWLIATSVFAALSAAAAIASFFLLIEPNATPSQIVQIAISKLVVLGLMVSATIWCGRQHRALMHQVAINTHRANALRTFQAFVQAAADENTKDAVLMETTRSIFAMTQSGYLGGNESPPNDGLRVVEMVRGAGLLANQ